MTALLLIAVGGAAAQLVDGGIGMGFGVTSTTILIFLAGLGPAQASAVVHTAELGTTLVSGISHWRFGNIDWKTVVRLAVPGSIAAFAGATVLSSLSLDAAAPITSAILFAVGLNLVWRFSRGRVTRKLTETPHSTPFLLGLGSVGGFVDATGGGGWGPVTTSTLLSLGKQQPRRIVGTVNTAEFLVTLGATLGFVVGLWEDLVANAAAVVALLVGGSLTAPVAAWLISRLNPILLGGFVGTAIVLLNVGAIVGGAENAFGFTMPTALTVALYLALAAGGVALTLRGRKRARANRQAAADQTPAVEATDPVPAPSSR